MNEFVTTSESRTVTAHEIFNNNIYLNYMTSKQQQACNYKYNFEICRMKSDGKGYKSLFKYFAS